MYLAIAGNIGSGKSSLTGLVADRYNLVPVYEAVDENPYLEDFYRQMDLYAFHSQIYFLGRRLKQHLSQVNPGKHIVQDRTVYEDAAVFATNLHRQRVMSDRDFNSYWHLYEAVTKALRPPDLLVYLKTGLPRLRKQIAQRGRGYEESITDEYLLQLGDLYDEWIGGFSDSRVLVLHTDDIDFVHDAADRAAVFDLLERHGLASPLL